MGMRYRYPISMVIAGVCLGAPLAVSAASTPATSSTPENHASARTPAPGSPSGGTAATAQVSSGTQHAHAASSAETPGCGSIKACDESTGEIFSLVWHALVIAGFAAAIYLFVKQWLRNPLVIESLDVPKDLQELGLSGPVLAQRLADHISELQQKARTDDGSAEQAIVELPRLQLDLQLPGTPWSMRSAIRYLKQALQKPDRRILGEVLPSGKAYAIRVRDSEGNAIDVPVHFKDARSVDSALEATAQAVLALVSPLELAAVFVSSETVQTQFSRTREAVERHLSTKPAHTHQSAYIMLASIAKEMADYGRMEEYIGLARLAAEHEARFAIFPRLGARYLNFLGGLARERATLDEAIYYYKKALRKSPEEIGIRSNLGLAYHDSNRFGRAAWFFRTVIWLRPRSSRGWRGLGLIEQRKGNLHRAVALYTRAIDVAPRARWPRLNRLDALRRIGGDASRWEQELQSLLAIDPDFGPMYRFWAQTLTERGDLDGALAKLERARTLSPNDVWNDIDMSHLYRQQGRTDEAMEVAYAALAKRPDHPDALRALAAAKIQAGELHEGKRILHQASARASWEIWSLLELSDLCRDQGHMGEAFAAVMQAVDRGANRSAALRRWARLHLLEGNPLAARRRLEQARFASPYDVWARLELADILRDSGDIENAEHVLEQALALRIKVADVQLRYATLFVAQGKFAQAEDRYKRAIDASSYDIGGFIGVADFYWQRGEKGKAFEALARADERRPNSPDVLRRWANFLVKEGDIEAAEQKSLAAVELAPMDIPAALDRATLLETRARVPEALALLERIGTRRPRSVVVLRRQASLLSRQTDWDAVEDKYRKAIEVSPRDIWSLVDYADFLYGRGRTSESRQIIERASAVQPDSPMVLRRAASILARLGEHGAAEEKLRKGVEKAPGDTDCLLALIDLLIQRGRFSEALVVAEQPHGRLSRSATVLRRWAHLLTMHGRWEAAREKFREAIEAEPAEISALLDFARFSHSRCNDADAYAALREATRRRQGAAEVFGAWADFHAQQGESQAAEENFCKGVEIEPSRVSLQLSYAHFLRGRNRRAHALEIIERASTKRPDAAELFRQWAKLLAERPPVENAAGKFAQAARVDPTNIRALLDLAELYWKEGDHTEARAVIDTAIERQPRSAEALLRREAYSLDVGEGNAWEAQYKLAIDMSHPNETRALHEYTRLLMDPWHRNEEALQVATRAVERHPQAPGPRLVRARLLASLKKYRDAAEDYCSAMAMTPFNEVYSILEFATFLEQRGLKEQALVLLEHAGERQPTLSHVMRRRADLLEALGDVPAAQGIRELAMAFDMKRAVPLPNPVKVSVVPVLALGELTN